MGFAVAVFQLLRTQVRLKLYSLWHNVSLYRRTWYYSPDLNPIEEAFSKTKNIVRKAGARTRQALVEAIAKAISSLTLEDVAGWFAHCGYYPQDHTHEHRRRSQVST